MEKIFGVLFSLYRGSARHGEWVVACLQGAWSRLLGERLASFCRPASFDGSTLVIEAVDNKWGEAVRSIHADLLEKLQTATAGEVRRISVVIEPNGVERNRADANRLP